MSDKYTKSYFTGQLPNAGNGLSSIYGGDRMSYNNPFGLDTNLLRTGGGVQMTPDLVTRGNTSVLDSIGDFWDKGTDTFGNALDTVAPQTQILDPTTGALVDNGRDWGGVNAGLGLLSAGLGYLSDKEALELQKQGLANEIKDSEFARETTAQNLGNQARVRGSLAAAFGESKKPYSDQIGLAEKYGYGSNTKDA